MESASKKKSSASSNLLAPGFRFHPTDEELVRYYLRRKVCGKTFQMDAIAEIDIYKAEPWDLPSEKKAIHSPDVRLQTNQGGYMADTTKAEAGDESNKYRSMDSEFTSNEYTGLGANDRHTPHPQLEDTKALYNALSQQNH